MISEIFPGGTQGITYTYKELIPCWLCARQLYYLLSQIYSAWEILLFISELIFTLFCFKFASEMLLFQQEHLLLMLLFQEL